MLTWVSLGCYLTLLYAIRRYSTLLDATRRCSTLPDAARRCSTLLDAARRCSTLLDAARRCSTLLDAARRCSTLLDDARRCLAGRLSRQTWPADLAGRLGRQTLFHLKNRLKTRVALLELLDKSGTARFLSDIAVGNVEVPTCCF
jgi:hypothetical protein